MSRLLGSKNKPDHQKVEKAFSKLNVADQSKCLAVCGALHNWKLETEAKPAKSAKPAVRSDDEGAPESLSAAIFVNGQAPLPGTGGEA